MAEAGPPKVLPSAAVNLVGMCVPVLQSGSQVAPQGTMKCLAFPRCPFEAAERGDRLKTGVVRAGAVLHLLREPR